MKKNPKSPNTVPQKEDPTIKKDDKLREDKLQEDELNKVTGGTGSHTTGAGAGKVIFNPF
jgi:hypothetical protein